MRARTVRRSPAARGPRRKLVWARTATTVTLSTAAVTPINIMGRFVADLGAGLVGITVMRTRGTINWQCNSTGTPGVQHFLAAGLIVSDLQDAVVAPEPSDPELREHLDWYFHRWETWFFNGMATGQVAPNQTAFAMREWEIDVRSKRKIDEVEQLPVLNLKCPTASGVNTVSVGVTLSTLIALP